MKGIELPPPADDFTADPVELFFDLAYVFAFSQLVGLLVHDPTWAGIGKAVLLFGMLWLPWQQLTWAANAVSGNGRPIRLIFLAATVVSVPMAAATSTALGAGGVVFATALAGIMILGFLIQFLSTDRGTVSRTAVVRWVAPNIAAIVVLMVGSGFESQTRITIWSVYLAIVVFAMIAAGGQEWVVRPGHFAERHALIVIIALGEVIVAIGIPVVAALQEGAGLPTSTVAALAASGMLAGLLWWSYFDMPGPGLEHRGSSLELDRQRGRYARDIYTWMHAPLVAGIIVAAAGLEEIALHLGSVIPTPFRLMMAGGLAMTYLAVAGAVWRAYRVPAWERILTAILIGVVVAVTGSRSGLAVVALVVGVMLFMLLVEHQRVGSRARAAI